MTVEVIRATSLGELPHGFLGRRGGVSTGGLAGLNVGYGSRDDRAAIDANRRRAIEALLPNAELATVHQVHSAEAVKVETAWPYEARPHADAVVTDRQGILLGILTADCAPVLFADETAGVIGAAHAGWRGALAGVTDQAIAAMERLGARRDRIAVAVGPCIAQASYEVGPELFAAFTDEDPAAADLFEPVAGSDRLRFDLKGYVLSRLARAGLERRAMLPDDTYADEARFFSARRTRQRGGKRFGLLLSAIALLD